MKHIKLWFFRWAFYWLYLLDGLIGVISFATVHSNFGLKMAGKVARQRFKNQLKPEIKKSFFKEEVKNNWVLYVITIIALLFFLYALLTNY